MLFPEAEVTKSLSNMIKAYTVRYKEELRVIDIEKQEEAIQAKVEEASHAGRFVGGLHAISLEEQENVVPEDTEYAFNASGEQAASLETAESGNAFDASAMQAWREEERSRLKAELLEEEKVALRLELEKAIRTQADVIIEQAKKQAEQLKEKAKQDAETEKSALLESAKQQGYEEGKQLLQQELDACRTSFEEKERLLQSEFEKKASELEPLAAEVVIKLMEGLIGVCLESRKGIVTYLVSKALSEADRSNSFLIKVSKEDFEEVRGASNQLRSLFEREVILEVVQDALLKKGECMIETDSNIIDCSLGTQLEGLIEDIRLLSVQERI